MKNVASKSVDILFRRLDGEQRLVKQAFIFIENKHRYFESFSNNRNGVRMDKKVKVAVSDQQSRNRLKDLTYVHFNRVVRLQ